MSRCPQCGMKECCGADMDPQITDLRAKLAEAERERDAFWAEREALFAETMGLRAEVARVKEAEKRAEDYAAHLFDARASAEPRLAALREAVEKAPHGSACLYLIPRSAPMGETRTAGCNCWKKSALDKSAE